MRVLKITLASIGVVQLALGMILLIPGGFASVLGLERGPGWVDWQLAMAGARFLGFGAGMLLAARYPRRYAEWIWSMVAIQAIDWIATIGYLVGGAVALSQVTTASFLPLVFIAVLVRYAPRRRRDLIDRGLDRAHLDPT